MERTLQRYNFLNIRILCNQKLQFRKTDAKRTQFFNVPCTRKQQ